MSGQSTSTVFAMHSFVWIVQLTKSHLTSCRRTLSQVSDACRHLGGRFGPLVPGKTREELDAKAKSHVLLHFYRMESFASCLRMNGP